MDTAEGMRKHLNARPHDGTPNARLKGATQILKLTLLHGANNFFHLRRLYLRPA